MQDDNSLCSEYLLRVCECCPLVSGAIRPGPDPHWASVQILPDSVLALSVEY